MCVQAHHISSDFLQSYPALPSLSGRAAIRQVGFEMKPRLSYAGMTKDGEAVLSSFTFFFCLKQEVANTHTQRLAQTEMSDLFLSDVKYLIHTHPLTSALPPSPRFFYFIFIMQFSLFLMGARQ